MPPEHAGQQPAAARTVTSARTKLLVALGTAIVAGVAAALAGPLRNAPLIGWDVLAFVYGSWVWLTVWPLDPASAAAHATREDPGRDLADLLLLCAAIASLITVGMVLFGSTSGNARYGQAALAVVSVFLTWTLLQTVFTLKYARLYYSDTPGGIDFNDPVAPDYHDFAYLAVTIGMTFQVSDTDIQSKQVRRTVLRQASLSFPLAAVIIATTINLVAGLAK